MRLRKVLCIPVVIALCVATDIPALAQSSFPFGQEFLLDAAPMRGSKRIPALDIAENGAVEIRLWCATLQGTLVVVQNTVTIIPGRKPPTACPPDRERADDALLAALGDATEWTMQGETLVLRAAFGPPLRFRPQTN